MRGLCWFQPLRHAVNSWDGMGTPSVHWRPETMTLQLLEIGRLTVMLVFICLLYYQNMVPTACSLCFLSELTSWFWVSTPLLFLGLTPLQRPYQGWLPLECWRPTSPWPFWWTVRRSGRSGWDPGGYTVSWWFLDRMWLSEKKKRMDPTCQVYMFWLWLANYVTCSAPFLYPRSCASLNLLKIMLYFPMGNPLLGESIVNSDIFWGSLRKSKFWQ